MGYSLYIKKNIILKSEDVQVKSEIAELLGPGGSITLSKVIFDLSGWDVAEAFDSYRTDGTEIDAPDLKEFLENYSDKPFPQLENPDQEPVFYTYFESY